MGTGPLLQSVGALPADMSPSAVYQPAAQAVCGIGSVLCEAALLGGEPSYSRPHTRTNQGTLWIPCPWSDTSYLTQNEWTGGNSGAMHTGVQNRTMHNGGCGNHQQQPKGPAAARVRRLNCDGALAIHGP